MPPAMTTQPAASTVRCGHIAGRRGDDRPSSDPDIAEAHPAIGRIDDLAAGDPGQHGQAPSPSAAAISPSTAAASAAAEGSAAGTA